MPVVMNKLCFPRLHIFPSPVRAYPVSCGCRWAHRTVLRLRHRTRTPRRDLDGLVLSRGGLETHLHHFGPAIERRESRFHHVQDLVAQIFCGQKISKLSQHSTLNENLYTFADGRVPEAIVLSAPGGERFRRGTQARERRQSLGWNLELRAVVLLHDFVIENVDADTLQLYNECVCTYYESE